jgi:hypothetical protein
LARPSVADGKLSQYRDGMRKMRTPVEIGTDIGTVLGDSSARTIESFYDPLDGDDWYPSFQRLAAFANDSDNVPNFVSAAPGFTYLLDRWRVNNSSPNLDVFFQGVRGLTINLNGSTVKVAGGFSRTFQQTRTIMPLRLEDCEQVLIHNGTLDGNNETITNPFGLAESEGHGIYLGACLDVKLANLTVRNFISDSILCDVSNIITNPRRTCRRVILDGVNCWYSGRQGLSLVAVHGFTARNSEFSHTGQTSYGAHSPGMGVDIEPGRFSDDDPPNNLEVDTGQITFDTCRFFNNWGQIFGTTWGAYVKAGVAFLNCDMDVGTGNTESLYAFIVGTPNTHVKFCRINLRDRDAFWGIDDLAGGSFTDNIVYGQRELFRSINASPVLVANNQFVSTRTADSVATFGSERIINFQNPNGRWIGNYVFATKEGWVSEGAVDRHFAFNLQGLREASGNTYVTDLEPDRDGATRAHYFTRYGETAEVRNEKYEGAAPGNDDTIQPEINGHHDTTALYGSKSG